VTDAPAGSVFAHARSGTWLWLVQPPGTCAVFRDNGPHSWLAWRAGDYITTVMPMKSVLLAAELVGRRACVVGEPVFVDGVRVHPRSGYYGSPTGLNDGPMPDDAATVRVQDRTLADGSYGWGDDRVATFAEAKTMEPLGLVDERGLVARANAFRAGKYAVWLEEQAALMLAGVRPRTDVVKAYHAFRDV
jgi:hypothetical protein